jgi:ubiquinone/menaquinone biosynthesis C-methylase UbiE
MAAPDRSVCDAWGQWLSLARDRCHLQYRLEGRDLSEHIDVCSAGARETAERIARDVQSVAPQRVLEIGCSVGFNCLALAHRYPGATLVGLEPDAEAVTVGHVMARQNSERVVFVVATGERIPFRDNAFDLIVCHTVIEHVEDVPAVISEMARVLSPRGAIHLEAPNYLWPREPHLEVWCISCLGKRTIRLFARLQGKGRRVDYLDHLQLVTPRRLERLFRRNRLVWENRARTKLRMIADGRPGMIKAYRTLGSLLRVMKRLRIAPLIVEVAVALGIYPSVLYTIGRGHAGWSGRPRSMM